MENLKEVSLNDSTIIYKCYVWEVVSKNNLAGLISFEGDYRPGSLGRNDALFISWRIREFTELRTPRRINGIIIDFQNLNYTWGDDLQTIPRPFSDLAFPVRYLIPDSNNYPERHNAFKWAVNNNEISGNLSLALSEIETQIPDLSNHTF